MKGIGGEVVSTIGSTEFTIFGNTAFFQVVSEDFPIPCEGILGAEYFEKSGAIVDFRLRLLKIGENYSRFMERRPTDSNKNKEDIVRTNNSSETKENETSEDDVDNYPFTNSKERNENFASWKDEFNVGEE